MRSRSRALTAIALLSGVAIASLPTGLRAAEPAAPPAIPAMPAMQAPPPPPIPPVPPANPPTLSIGSTCLNSLSIISGPTARVVSGPGSLSSANNNFTFRANGHDCSSEDDTVLMLPTQTSIEIRNLRNEGTDYSIADIHGSIDATTGNGELTVDDAATLTLKMVGTGDVHVGRVTGRLNVQDVSSGDLRIDTLNTSTTTLTNMSSGDLTIDGGATAALTVRDYSSGDITLKGSIHDADVSVLGSGDVTLEKVTQSLTKRVLGSGSLSIADSTGAKITAISTPDSDAVVSDVTNNILNQLRGQKIFQSDGTHDHSHHHGGGSLIGLLLKIALIIWAVRLYRRYRKTGVIPFSNTANRLARAYAAGVRGWERFHKSSEASPIMRAGTVARDAWDEFRHNTSAQPDSTPPSVPPGHPLARLQDRLARLEPRIGRLERFVTSSEFGLERQFRDLERAESTGR